MPLKRKTQSNPALTDFKGRPGALLRGDKVYNGARVPNPVGRNQHNPRINKLAKKFKRIY